MKKIWKSSVLLTTILLLAGCAEVPNEAVDAARMSVEDAQMQEADIYASDLFAAAQDSLAAAQTEIDLQKGKFAMMRDYTRAEELLTISKQIAANAATAGITRKEELRTETETLLADARQAAVNAGELLQKAPRGKEGRIALVAISNDVDSLSVTFGEVERLLSNDDVISANELARVALQQAQSLTHELQSAIDRTKSPVRG